MRLYLKKTHHRKGLVEWLKVKAQSSNPGTTKKPQKLCYIGQYWKYIFEYIYWTSEL
jgi:hypothetical protein